MFKFTRRPFQKISDEEFVQQMKDYRAVLRRSRRFYLVTSWMMVIMCLVFAGVTLYLLLDFGPQLGGIAIASCLLAYFFGSFVGFKAGHALTKIFDTLKASRTEELMLRYHDALQEIQHLQESQNLR